MGDERRQHGRHSVDWVAAFGIDGQLCQGQAFDVSPTGVLLRVFDPLPPNVTIGSRTRVEVSPDPDEKIEAFGTVRWIRTGASGDKEMGIEFDDAELLETIGNKLARAYFWSSPPCDSGIDL